MFRIRNVFFGSWLWCCTLDPLAWISAVSRSILIIIHVHSQITGEGREPGPSTSGNSSLPQKTTMHATCSAKGTAMGLSSSESNDEESKAKMLHEVPGGKPDQSGNPHHQNTVFNASNRILVNEQNKCEFLKWTNSSIWSMHLWDVKFVHFFAALQILTCGVRLLR